MVPMRRVFVDPGSPQRDAIQEAAIWILRGGIVALPTDTLYGLAADPFNEDAVSRLFTVKGRGAQQALPLMAADEAQVTAHLGSMSSTASVLARRFWPGPLTLLVSAPRTLARGVTGGAGTVGVRVPGDEVARAICAACGRPITATSANISGQPATADPADVERALGDRIDFLVDTGPTRGGAPSTIVDVSGGEPRLVRVGAIAWDEIQAWLHTVQV